MEYRIPLVHSRTKSEPGHRGDTTGETQQSRDAGEPRGGARRQRMEGSLIGAGWGGRPDTFTVAAALAARTTSFEPLIAIRPRLLAARQLRRRRSHSRSSQRRTRQGQRRLRQGRSAAYGDSDGDQADRYARTREFLQLVRRLWTEENVTFHGEHFHVENSTVLPRIVVRGDRRHPTLYFGGASEAAERVSPPRPTSSCSGGGETLDGVAGRIERLKALSDEVGREHRPLEFGLRITTFVRDTTEQAWNDAEAKVAEMADTQRDSRFGEHGALPQNPPHRRTRSASDACSTSPPEGRSSTTTCTRSRGAVWRRRRGHHLARRVPRTTSRSRCASTRISGSPTSCCPTLPTYGRSNGRAANCCRYCAGDRRNRLSGNGTRTVGNHQAPTVTDRGLRSQQLPGLHRDDPDHPGDPHPDGHRSRHVPHGRSPGGRRPCRYSWAP